ncbi:hypothetical protein, partial [Escherichia coli]|uniref:hypothetical protein n=1 Tax=Escherichia coli TaxID=562 RepID=UPI000509AC46
MTNYVNCKNSEGSGNYRKLLKSEQKNILLIFMGFTGNNKGTRKRLYVSDLLMNPLMILVKIIKLRWIHILSYDQMVSRKIN